MSGSMLHWIRAASETNRWLRACVKPVMFMALVAVFFCLLCPEVDAAPGGQFVKQALSTKFGKIGAVIVGVLMCLLAILLLPLYLYITLREYLGIRRTKSDLAKIATKYSWFEWESIQKRVKNAIRKIADVWQTGDLSSVSSFMTSDYFASQQELLQRWADEGKQIVYRLEKIRRIEPLAFGVEDPETHSWIRVLVSVNCIDYMRDKFTLEVVQGEVEPTTGFETVWFFVFNDGKWLLNGIEKGTTSLAWATTKNGVDTSYLDYVSAKQRGPVDTANTPSRPSRTSQPAALDPETDDPVAQPKKRLIRKPTADDDQ